MGEVDWDSRAEQGVALQSVIDPADTGGRKNRLIDRIQWGHIAPWARQRRSVLDFGCGIGRFAMRLHRLGLAYCGVDTSAAMIDAARRLHPEDWATFLRAPSLPLPFEAGRFDGCLTVGVLQCIKRGDGSELRATLGELARVLAPGGELLLIEQASVSGGYSGSVVESATEEDFIGALAGWFDVTSVQRVRCGTLSPLSSLYIRAGGFLPGARWIEGLLARREAAIARRADAVQLRQQVYYDVAIRAVRCAGG